MDQLHRVTCVIGIDKYLHKLLPRRQAEKWAQMPDMRFRGGTPLFNMVDGGVLAMWAWQQSLGKQVTEGQKNVR